MKIVLDTTEFEDWCYKKYNINNSDFHKKIWAPYMCDYFMDAQSSVGFSIYDKPKNIFEEHMNEFIIECEPINKLVWLEFTN